MVRLLELNLARRGLVLARRESVMRDMVPSERVSRSERIQNSGIGGSGGLPSAGEAIRKRSDR